MKTRFIHSGTGSFILIISTISLIFWIHVVQAVPPGKTYKERRAMAELDKDIKVGMSYAEIQTNTFTGPIIESTGFELSDGFDPPNPDTGFNGFICGDSVTCNQPFFTSCQNPDNGWLSGGVSCTQPHIDSISPFVGQQHLRFELDDSVICDVSPCLKAISPSIGGPLPIGPHTMSVDIAASGQGGSHFIAFWVSEKATRNISAYVYFYSYGGVYAFDYATGFNFLGRRVIPDYTNLTIHVDPCNNVTTYSYNGQVVLTLSESTTPTENSPWVSFAILKASNGNVIWDVDNFSIERGDPCPSTCGADGIEPGEECEFERVCFSGPNEGNPCVSDDDCGSGGSCLVGDHYCPGRCVPPGETGLNGEEECTCNIPGTDPCVATDLPNGISDYLTHGGWFTFVADTPATAIETCGSEGFDSFLVVLTNSDGSDDCSFIENDTLNIIGLNYDCGTDFSGSGDGLASCYDREGPGWGPGFPWEACLCVPTTIGQRYWVWEYGGGVLGANIHITKTKRLICHEVWENGACCDDINGVCTDEVAPENCAGDFETFTLNKLCESPSYSCVPTTIGACCDRLDGFCSETIISECSGAQPLWTPGKSCGEVVCDPAMGACCNTRFGTCTQDILANCIGENRSWTKGDSCNDRTCPDPFVPTVSQWGLMVMTLLLMIAAKIYFNRREVPTLT